MLTNRSTFCSLPKKEASTFRPTSPLSSFLPSSPPLFLFPFMLSPSPASREMLRSLFLLSVSSLLLLQGSNALCVPRASNFKASKQDPPPSNSSGSSPANVPTKPPPSAPSPAQETNKPPPSAPSPANVPTKPPPSAPSPAQETNKPPPSAPSPAQETNMPPPSAPSPAQETNKPPPSTPPVNVPPTKPSPSPSPPSPVDEPDTLASQSVPSPAKAPAKSTGSGSSGSVPSNAAHPPAKTSSLGASGVGSSIEGLCKKTNHPEVCMSSVQPYLPSSGQLGPKDMLLLQIQATAAKVDSATAHANQLLTSPTMTPYLKSCLQTCKDLYGDMKANFEDAKKALAMSDVSTVKTMISATVSDASTCEDGFLESPGVPLLMGSYDSELSKLTSNCLAFADLI